VLKQYVEKDISQESVGIGYTSAMFLWTFRFS